MLALAVAGGGLAFWTWGAWPDVLVDFGRELYVPWRLVEGDVLYRDVAYFNGPLSPHWNALWFALLGPGLSTLVWLNLFLLAVATALLHRLLAAIAGPVPALVACLVFLGIFAFGQQLQTGNYNWVCPYSHEATHGLILAFAALACLRRFGADGRRVWPALAGLSLGLAFLTQAAVFVAAAASSGVMLAGLLAGVPRARARAGRTLGIFAAAALLPALVAFGWLRLAMPAADALGGVLGSWPHVLAGEVAGLPFYRRSMGLDQPVARLGAMAGGVLAYVALLAPAAALALLCGRRSLTGRGVTVAAFLIAFVALTLASGRIPWRAAAAPLPVFVALAAAGRAHALRRSDVSAADGVLALAFATLAFVLLGRMILNARVFHYGFTLAAPATALCVVAAVGWLPAWIGRRGGHAGVLRAVALAGLAVGVGAHLATASTNLERKTVTVGTGPDAFRTDRRGLFVNPALEAAQTLGPDRTLAVLPEGVMLNYLSRRRAPTRFTNFMPPELLMYGGEPAWLAAFEARPPDLVMVVYKDLREYGYRQLGDDYAPALFAWVEARYRPVRTLANSPLTSGRRFGIALLVAREGPASTDAP